MAESMDDVRGIVFFCGPLSLLKDEVFERSEGGIGVAWPWGDE